MKYIFIIIMFSLAMQAKPIFYINDNNAIDLDTLYPKHHKLLYYVKNLGDEELQIESLAASCGCTDFDIEKRSIAPNDSAALNIDFDLQKFIGERTNFIYFETNDPDLPTLKFPIRMFVYRDLLVNPKNLPTKINVLSEKEIEYKFNIINTGKKDVLLKFPIHDMNDKYDVLGFSAENEIIKSGENKSVSMIIRYRNEAGFVISKVKIPTSSKILPVIEMQLTASVKDV